MLRRTKNSVVNGKPILQLPARNVQVVQCEFDEDEREFYNALADKVALTFNKYLKAGEVMKNYTSVLTLLLRLRQGRNARF
jgi:SNF2 family DNA or RNA helicase